MCLPKINKEETEDSVPKGFLKQRMLVQLKKTYEWIDFTKEYPKEYDWESALEEGRKKASQYSLGKFLGKGVFADVFSCHESSGNKHFAYKKFREREKDFIGFLREKGAFSTLEGAHYLVKYQDSFVKDYFQGVIVLEYLKIPSLDHTPFRLSEVRKLGFQLISSLACFEKAGLIHGDLKSKNISVDIDSGLLKVFDLDLTIPCDEVNKKTPLQTLWYRAPEVLLRRKVDCTADMWSVGCVLTELFLGSFLFVAQSNYDQELGQLQTIVTSIGLPRSGYLEESPGTKDYFEKTDPATFKCKGIPLQSNAPNRVYQKIAARGKFTNETETDVIEFWDLMRQVIRYENRLSATQALAHPFFERFTFLEFVKKRRIHARLDLIGDGKTVLSINLDKTPTHSMQAFKRSSDNRYTLKLTDVKTKQVAIQNDIAFQSGDVLYLDKTGSVANKV